MTLKLHSLQLPKEYKFIQEEIIEGIWPFSQLKSPFNFIFLSFVYFIAGVGLYVLFDIPIRFLIAGIFAGAAISIWTYGIFQYADRLRNAEIGRMTSVKRKFLNDFLEEKFHHRSLFFGVMLFVATLTYFWTSKNFLGVDNIFTNLENLMGSPLHPFIIFYALVITFDVCYRFGLSGYISLVILWRNFRMAKILKNPRLKQKIIPSDLIEMQKNDWYHSLAFSSGIFLIPLGMFDRILLVGLIFYLILSSLALIASTLHLQILRTKAIPNEILDLLSSSKFAYIGTITDKKIPHVTPTLFVYDGRKIFFVTSISSYKIKNLRKHKDVAVTIHHESSKNHC